MSNRGGHNEDFGTTLLKGIMLAVLVTLLIKILRG